MKTSRIQLVVGGLAIALALGLPRPAAAEDRAEAERFFRLGAEAYKGGLFDAAAANFDRAYEHLAAPEIAFSAAQAHRLQYQADRDRVHLERAIALYEAYVAGAPGGAKRKDALIYLERLRDTLGKLGAGPAAAEEKPSIYVSISLADARITIDGQPVERYTAIEVPPGEHVVAVSAEGYFPAEQKVPVGKGRVMVPFELAARPATLTIKSQRDARITVDGRPVLLRGSSTDVPAGKRWITVSARGRRPISREVVLAPEQQLTLDAPLQPTAQRRAVRWVAIGAGALLGGAIATTAVTLHADFSAAGLRDREVLPAGEAARYEQLRDRRDAYRTASFLLGGAALAAAAVAAVMYYVDEPSPDAPLQPIEQAPGGGGGFTPVAIGDGLGLGLGYAGGF